MFSFNRVPAALSLLVASLLVPSYSVRLPRSLARQINIDQIEGAFKSTSTTGDGTCPDNIIVSGITPPAKDAESVDYIVTSASRISVDGKECDENTLTIVTSELAQNPEKLAAVEMTADLAKTIEENSAASTTLNGIDNANVNVGFFDKETKCGSYSFPAGAILFFLSTGPTETQVISITSAPNAPASTIKIQSNSQAFISTDGKIICIAQDTLNDGNDRDVVIPQPTPTADPEPTDVPREPTTTPEASEEGTVKDCFPAFATVELGSGLVIPISALKVGDTVKTGVDSASEVILFTHREADSRNEFLQLTAATGHVITLSSGHYVHVGSHGRLMPARGVEVGDTLLLGSSGAWSQITKKTRVRAQGLYNPQTIDGNVVVNGVVASTYTTAVHPHFAHRTLMAPVRWVYRLPFESTRLFLGSLFENGSPMAASLLPGGPNLLNF